MNGHNVINQLANVNTVKHREFLIFDDGKERIYPRPDLPRHYNVNPQMIGHRRW